MEMSKANQIQIGMLGVIIVLLLLQVSGIVGGSSSSDLRAQEKQNILNPSTPASSISPSTPAVNAATPATPAEPAAPTGPKTVISFNEEAFDFGTIPEGEVVEHTFKFKNTGKEPLTISNAKGSCGCTVPDYPKTPIMPGETAQIEIRYDTKRLGLINKSVTITTNQEGDPIVLKVKGKINKAIQEESVPKAKTGLIKSGNN